MFGQIGKGWDYLAVENRKIIFKFDIKEGEVMESTCVRLCSGGELER